MTELNYLLHHLLLRLQFLPSLHYAAAMRRDDALTAITQQAEAMKARGVIAAYLFGSVARDEAGPTSDIDVFVDIEPLRKFSLIDLSRLHLDLSAALKTEVDVTTRGSLHPLLRDEIERNAIRVF
ncbi:MAG: nucleotidyltransferase family protein [Beijerinckiaceae bacterium]